HAVLHEQDNEENETEPHEK
ncbi:hypothetical protein CP02DC18_0374B, partial [Chlamydia psittaci 02DC18]